MSLSAVIGLELSPEWATICETEGVNMEENEGKQGLKINDRRRFDASGNEIDNSEPSATRETPKSDKPRVTLEAVRAAASAEAQPQQASAERPRPAAVPEPESEEDDVDEMVGPEGEGMSFHSFIMSLAHQALMLLGEIPGPDGKTFPPDKDAARQTIDILSMLEHKTRGNLNAEEKHFLEEILHELRLRFVRG
jgi:hypothetical protein